MMCMKGAVPESVFGCAGYLFPAGDLVARRTRTRLSRWPACRRSSCTWPSTPAAPAPPAARWVTC